MNRTILWSVAGLLVAAAVAGAGFLAGQRAPAAAPIEVAATDEAAAPERQEVELIVRDYLLKNPEILLEVQQALDAKQKEEQRLAALGVIKDARADIFNAEFDGIVGNPEGKVSIVEFYDYNCGYCKRAIEDMRALTAADPELRFVLKEFPILGPDSQKAHVVSMALRKLMPEKYAEFHNRLLGGQGRAGEANAIKIALELGADEAALREAMKDPAIPAAFEKTYELANRLSITGTPSYVVGNEVVFGALGQQVLAEKIAAAKACLDASC